MLSTSTDLLFIALSICVVAFTAFVCYLIYNLTQTVKESTKTMQDVNKKLEKVDPMVDDLTETVGSVTETVRDINKNILKPIASISQIFKKFKNITSVFSEKEK